MNIILEYTNHIKEAFLKFFQLVLGVQYDDELVNMLLDTYINVRYYNVTNYPDEKDFIERIGKELKKIVNPLINSDNKEKIKNTYSLYGYLIYFDDCCFNKTYKELIDCLYQDKNMKIMFEIESYDDILEHLKKLKKEKEKFMRLFDTNQFFLEENRIKKNIYKLKIGHNVKVSNLYSDHAIEKAFNTGVVSEDKMFIQLIMASEIILNNAIGLDFSRFYIVDFPISLFSKVKKIEKFFCIVDNELTKKYLIFNIKYEDYLFNKEIVLKYIKKGFSFSVLIDHSFDEDYADLVLFSYVFVDKEDEKFDIIKENRDLINTNLVTI